MVVVPLYSGIARALYAYNFCTVSYLNDFLAVAYCLIIFKLCIYISLIRPRAHP